ncbi:SDR family oxidoreductase [Myxococcus sp. NMCA1]|uniref:SDR family oxidoreductase n=1 Tax=Myxococcus sp. NMCA1 TaxID=2996785 RepID=UPI002285CD1B|nr:SDR family oxidoreductase [Myxococcus sp. NMCA1]WAM25462.1 SDR family oxidoreductase [Myxococcus sp. NMCA1]
MTEHPMARIYGGTPHRFPMLLVDAVEALSPGFGRTFKQVSGNEMMFERFGDAPPALPSCLLVDALGQVAIMLLREPDEVTPSVWYLGGIEAMTFHTPIPAGSVLRMEANILKRWRTTVRVEVKAWATLSRPPAASWCFPREVRSHMSHPETNTPFLNGLLHQQVVLVTGAGQPIANAIARRHGKAGARLALVFLPEHEAEATALARELSAELALACESSDAQAVGTVVRRVATELGRIDLLINASLSRAAGRLSDLSAEQWKAVLDRQLSGTAWFCKEVIRPMMRKRSGRIVNLLDAASGGASRVAAEGITAMTRALANEVARQGISVNTLAVQLLEEETAHLSPAQRERLDGELGPLGRLGSAEEIAEAVLFLGSSAANLTTGQRLSATGGLW